MTVCEVKEAKEELQKNIANAIGLFIKKTELYPKIEIVTISTETQLGKVKMHSVNIVVEL